MSLSTLIPEIWAPEIQTGYDSTIVAARLFNHDYEGSIAAAGDTVRINTIDTPAISTYAGTVAYEDLDSSEVVLSIDQSKYWAFNVNDLDAKQAIPGWVAKAAGKAGVGQAQAVDSYVLGLIDTVAEVGSAIGTETVGVDVNSSNIIAQFGEMARKLDDKFVPEMGRFAIVSPAIYQKLVLAKVLNVTNNEAVFADGQVNQVAGFQVFKSQNVKQTSATSNHKCVFGVSEALTVAQQILSTESLRGEGSFSDKVRGLSVFGAKVVNKNLLGVGFFNPAAEA